MSVPVPPERREGNGKTLRVFGATENNLKNVSLRIPKRKITIFTGVSGSGKSSIVFDTIANEAQRLLNENFSLFIRNFLPRYPQPWVAWEQAMLEDQYAAMTRGDWEPTFRQFWTGNASVAREEIVAAGGFDPAFRRAEDVELGARLARRGVGFRFHPAARTLHAADRTLDSWCAMHSAYGRLERRIFAHLGEAHADSTLRGNWARLHPATRSLVRACLRSEAFCKASVAGLRAILQASRLAPASVVARRACSALANILYWSGAREAMGAQALREMSAA